MSTLGKIYIYTGKGIGKSCAALGMAIKMAAEQQKIAYFIFDELSRSSWQASIINLRSDYLEFFNAPIKIRDYSSGQINNDIYPEDLEKAFNLLDQAKILSKTGKYDWLVLDEINVSLASGLISLEDFTKFLQNKPSYLNLILTGQNCPKSIFPLADFVTEMNKI